MRECLWKSGAWEVGSRWEPVEGGVREQEESANYRTSQGWRGAATRETQASGHTPPEAILFFKGDLKSLEGLGPHGLPTLEWVSHLQ